MLRKDRTMKTSFYSLTSEHRRAESAGLGFLAALGLLTLVLAATPMFRADPDNIIAANSHRHSLGSGYAGSRVATESNRISHVQHVQPATAVKPSA